MARTGNGTAGTGIGPSGGGAGAPPARTTAAGRLRGRFRRRPLLLGVAVVGLLSLLLVLALGARPSGDTPMPLAVGGAYEGTTYAFDGVVCLGSPVASSTVDAVEVEQAPGSTTRLVRRTGTFTLGFPVADDAGGPAEGTALPAGEQDCSLRVLVTPDRQGEVRAGALRVRLRYGPFGLLRRTVTLEPELELDVTGSGPDPRASVR